MLYNKKEATRMGRFFSDILILLNYYGFVTALPSRMTAVCASALPRYDAPVFKVIAVHDIMIPSK